MSSSVNWSFERTVGLAWAKESKTVSITQGDVVLATYRKTRSVLLATKVKVGWSTGDLDSSDIETPHANPVDNDDQSGVIYDSRTTRNPETGKVTRTTVERVDRTAWVSESRT